MEFQLPSITLIDSVEDVILNIKVFNKDLDLSEYLISKLSYFRHWYYVEELDLFGPSKFIGYKGNTSEEYRKGTNYESGYMSGIITQQRLTKLFDNIDTIDSDRSDELHQKLEYFLGCYDKKPNKSAKIYLAK